MPIDWLTLWGVTQAAGFLFKPALESLEVECARPLSKALLADRRMIPVPLLRKRAENDPTPWLREKAKRLADRIEARG